MKKKKVAVLRPNNVWESEQINISKIADNYYFEIGSELTADLGEAVAIMMRMKSKWNDEVWNLSISDVDYYNIDPSKAIYWLSGGDDEWCDGENYRKYWHECQLDFQEEFGVIIISILKNSKTLKDIRSGFLKHINLATLYNFAIDKSFV